MSADFYFYKKEMLNIDNDLIVKTPFTKNGHSDFTIQYKPAVFELVRNWISENNYPTMVNYKDKNGTESICRIIYK